jgi:hypothetical protein
MISHQGEINSFSPIYALASSLMFLERLEAVDLLFLEVQDLLIPLVPLVQILQLSDQALKHSAVQ